MIVDKNCLVNLVFLLLFIIFDVHECGGGAGIYMQRGAATICALY